MKQNASNTFTEGMIKDLNPLTTPSNVLTDCLNGTIITYNGNEFVLQNDMGNCKVERAKLSVGFIPVGMKEYGGIVYVASLNPETGVCEIGSFPSPEEDFSTTDFGNIGPANFLNSNFIVDTGDDSIKEKTEKNLKLFEPELMQLHPGDLYVVLYTLHNVGTDPDDISTEIKFRNYISQDPTQRKLFKLKFSKISDNNTLVEIPSTDIKVIPYQVDVEDEYVYFKEPSQATLAVGLELEELDIFDASVTDVSLNTQSSKKVNVSAIGYGNSLAYFQGIRVIVTSPVSQTFYLEKNGDNRKVGAILDGLAADDSFQCTVTPYSPYALYPKLTKNFNLTLGQYISAGSGVNNIFTYFTDLDNNFLKLDFDYRFQGNSEDGIHLYIEFYDPWSDYSVVKTVDNPTYYGLNSVIVELVDEPRVDQFDSTTVGGTPASKLITNSDTDFEKTLLNSSNLIRNEQVLRKNHFYIVRVSGVDKSYNPDTGLFTYEHFDFYKGLYTTDMYNSVYTSQTALSPNDSRYISDFNSLDFDITKIGYNTTITKTFTNSLPTVTKKYPQLVDSGTGEVTYPLMTNNDWYKVLTSTYTGDSTYKDVDTFETDTEYNVALDLNGTNYVFGDFKTSMLSVTFPTLLATDQSGTGYRPTIIEQTVPGTPATNSRAEWVATALSSVLYRVNLKAFTSRTVQAPATHTTQSGTKYEEIPLINSFHHYPNNDGPLSNPAATIEISQSPGFYKIIDPSGIVHQTNDGGFPPTNANSSTLYSAYEAYASTKRYSAFWGTMSNRGQFWYWPGAPGDYGDVHNTDTSHRDNILFLRNPPANQIVACRVHDIQIAKDFFNSTKVASNVTSDLLLYNVDSSQISKNGQVLSTFQFKDAPIITTFSPDQTSGSYVKTYLSTFRFKALSSIQQFNPTILNSYINSRKSDSTIVDNKQTIRDGFIPYIITPQQTSFNLVFDDIIINQSADSNAYTAFLNAKTIGLQDPAFAGVQNAKAHGTLFNDDSAGRFSTYLNKFTVAGFDPFTAIDKDKVYIYVKDPAEAKWQGYFRIGGSPKHSPAPNLYMDFQMA